MKMLSWKEILLFLFDFFTIFLMSLLTLMFIYGIVLSNHREPPYFTLTILTTTVLLAAGSAWQIMRYNRKAAPEVIVPSRKPTPGQITLVIILTLFCLPLGIFYIATLQHWKTSKRIALVCSCFPIFLMISVVTVMIIQDARPAIGKHVTAEECRSIISVPDGATDISYFRSFSITEFECSCTEEAFRKWSSRELKEINKLSYVKFIRIQPENEWIEVRRGLHTPYNQLSHAIYDRDTGKLYYKASPR